ncbi:hypothetical protein [Brevibacterium sp. UCMA 11752]|uniref:hypothetical protein n=1 Tax=Brevibacterium sp. UCMA 11752 TaxID=2745946 RepID=UPI001F201C37|nr:hypothetical protein [Brevibacterium sp. UCMA 11752]MCF2586105.1 hypothetical protein [Brevibacterium sp. UCMA 11752]
MNQPNFRVLEVSDRGTHGLDGPSDLSPAPGNSSARFQDLILKFGVSHNDGQTGGTYGFGKTAAFAYSGVGTIIYWTRCRNHSGNLEDRFIVSSFGQSYQQNGVQYTGRHWWGTKDGSQDSVLPLVGVAAAQLGDRFFKRGFANGETGTSLLILDPLVTDDNVTAEDESVEMDRFESSPADVESEFGRRARRAIRSNLWPKLIPELGTTHCPMELHLEVNDNEIALGSQDTGALGYWGAGLTAIRQHRSGETAAVHSPAGLPVKVIDVARYKKVIGHLALVKRVTALEQPVKNDDLDPSQPGSELSRIALMRGKAELVVTTVDWVDRLPLAGLDWLAVYKSADEFDDAYAQAEPPAHDNWVSDGSSNESARIVKHTKNRVKRFVTEEFYPERDGADAAPQELTITAGMLARRLGAMLPSEIQSPDQVGSRETIKRQDLSTGNPKKWSVEAEPPRLLGTDTDGHQRQEVAFKVSGQSGLGRVKLAVSLIGEDGLHEPVSEEVLDIVWIGNTRYRGQTTLLRAGTRAAVQFSGAPRRAMRVELTVGGIDGDS